MARRQPPIVDAEKAQQDREFLEAMATDIAGDAKTQNRAKLILAMADGATLNAADEQAGIGVATARAKVRAFNEGGWTALLTIQPPRGGDFLARYDLGFWAERLTRVCLDQSRDYRAIPYGTSRSEPFTDMQAFRQYRQTEFQLQAWSAQGRWKRPDLLMIPRSLLRKEQGNDTWTPDLQHFDNDHCRPYVEQAAAAIEVETSLWQVQQAVQARVRLSFTVKEEDLESLRNWVQANKVPLFIVQVFYDQAYALPFETLEYVIGLPANNRRRVVGKKDPTTKKVTYMIPLGEGILLGSIAEPDVEGKVFKAPNGKVTVYGRLTGSELAVADAAVLEQLAGGILKGGLGTASEHDEDATGNA
ncbi:MAG: AccI family restriction endonuclease [Gemmataceae bacterium]|nr:AccI family restriction endonuclease [Gemmataceae bacterium]